MSLGVGDSHSRGSSVSQLGSDYYRLIFEEDADGEALNVAVTGVPGGDYSYYLMWEKDLVWKRASFPFGVSGDYGFSETIDRDTANSLVLVISGRGNGGAYTIDVSVS